MSLGESPSTLRSSEFLKLQIRLNRSTKSLLRNKLGGGRKRIESGVIARMKTTRVRECASSRSRRLPHGMASVKDIARRVQALGI